MRYAEIPLKVLVLHLFQSAAIKAPVKAKQSLQSTHNYHYYNCNKYILGFITG